MTRLFIALPLPDDLRARIAGMQGGIDGARWVAPQNMHITLRFIGEVSGPETGDIIDALDDLQSPPFPVIVSGAGRFGSGDRSRAIWIGVDRTPQIVALHTKIDQALIRIGFEPEGRKYTPHVTVARFGSRGRGKRQAGPPATRVLYWLEAHSGFFTLPFEAREFILLKSHLGRNGPSYTPVATFPLVPAA